MQHGAAAQGGQWGAMLPCRHAHRRPPSLPLALRSVHTPGEFKKRLVEDFEFAVTPLVFDLSLEVAASSLAGNDSGWKMLHVWGWVQPCDWEQACVGCGRASGATRLPGRQQPPPPARAGPPCPTTPR